eukprot:TRINITY_DN2227_c1_g1_i1.p1 TRINITY_DN2227_c1_g1~~TRINITY_DN2227_c1_g1_i1.p1  ORF type:complete len:275 (-),score=44.94 TRINITY_DN2227_c1_g1_i1:80-820(-)
MESSLNYCVQVMINEEFLDVQMAKSLSLVSRLISNTVKRFIEDKYYFTFWNEKSCFTFYQPKHIRDVCSVEQVNVNVRSLKFYCFFDQPVNLSMLTNITRLEFSEFFKQPIQNRLPPNLIHLTLGKYFDADITNLFPPKLTFLKFGDFFNSAIDGLLPQKITHLELGYYFNQTINDLPHALIHLVLGTQFNQPIQTLPPKVESVLFKGDSYSQPKFNQSVSHLNPAIKFQVFAYEMWRGLVLTPYQ